MDTLSRSHSKKENGKLSQNSHVNTSTDIFGLYALCILFAHTCYLKLLVIERSVHVSDGFPKKVWLGGWGELYLGFLGLF